MTKVITYGTYDLLHFGHIRLLERAKELGDYLIVGVTADDFDKTRGKINVQQSLMERVEAVRATGLADEIIIEEYEGQKIDDIKRYDVDIFTVGSDWVGYFDYLKEFCEVVYLERTQGISSSELREEKRSLSLGLVGDSFFLNKVNSECRYVNGIRVEGIYTKSLREFSADIQSLPVIADSYTALLDHVDAVYIKTKPQEHYEQVSTALKKGKHVLCESPVVLMPEQLDELKQLAAKHNVIFMEAIKTAYATAYQRMLLLLKGGKIGDVVSVDATCTSMQRNAADTANEWNCVYEWGPTGLLPIFQILGTDYSQLHIATRKSAKTQEDIFCKADFVYKDAVASIKVGSGVKSEGELVISGTKGYVYVPAPWWKTDYFEIRYEDPAQNKRYFYQLDGEGIRNELVTFVRSIERNKLIGGNSHQVTMGIARFMEAYLNRKDS